MAKQPKDGGITWTNETWNPIRGCSRVSHGCEHCYAERVAARFSGPGLPYEGLAIIKNGDPHWTGEVRFIEERLADPLRWKRPRMIFVNSMSDLFHEKVKDEWIKNIFSIMESARQHRFQILTKRPQRMLDWVNKFDGWLMYAGQTSFTGRLPHVWLGVSVEDQKTAGERIPLLLQTPAAVRWVSYEPALGPVDFDGYLVQGGELCIGESSKGESVYGDGLDWIVVGGESGPEARGMDIAWARETVRQCKAAGVPCFVKQLGKWPRSYTPEKPPWEKCGGADSGFDGVDQWVLHRPKDGHAGDMSEWPEDLRVREFPIQSAYAASS